MYGEFIEVWPASWREIWVRLASHRAAPDDLFCQLYDGVIEFFTVRVDTQARADIVNDPSRAKAAFKEIVASDFRGESVLVSFLEQAHVIIRDCGTKPLVSRYFNLLDTFIDKYSLRYGLRRPCTLYPTLPGMFASLMRDLRTVTSRDDHLGSLMEEFESAIRDLHIGCSSGRIKTCIQKQVNLLEAIGRAYPRVTETELGGICNQVGTWPHNAIKASLKNLYGFASEYPGIRHGGNPASAIRAIQMRDMVAVSIVLTGFAPYLTDQLDADKVYRGG